MRHVFFRLILPCLSILWALHLSSSGWGFSADQKMKPEEVVARHLEALGTPEARAAVKTRIMNGEAWVDFLQGDTGQLAGKAQFVSDAERTRLEMRFGYNDYEAEQLIFDGKKYLVGNVRPAVRSTLGIFVNDYVSSLLKEGILGGVTNVGWALGSGRKLNLSYRGLKELHGKTAHILRYQSKRGDLRVDLGFDPETFRHVITDYYLEIPAGGVDRPEESINQRDSYWRAYEEFDDFRQVDGITLPHTYKLRVQFDGRITHLTEWRAKFSEVQQNQELSQDVFKLR